MDYKSLQQTVWQANIDLVESGLVVLTWGNASGTDENGKIMGIKPSGIDYASLEPEDIVVLSVETGEKLKGDLNPSSDTPTHLEIYRAFSGIRGVTHTHSKYAAAWAQAALPIPCYGTTHADHFYGCVPVTRQLTAEEIENAYERYSGVVIVEYFKHHDIDPFHVPAALLPHHGPFTWGKTAADAVKNAIALEAVAEMALHTEELNPDAVETSRSQLNKHFMRKHGPDAYYGQK